MDQLNTIYFGEKSIRCVAVSQVPWFCGKDLCDALGYKEGCHLQVVRRIKEIDKKPLKDLIEGVPNNNDGNTIYINEFGVISVVLKCKFKQADDLQMFIRAHLEKLKQAQIQQMESRALHYQQKLAITEKSHEEMERQLDELKEEYLDLENVHEELETKHEKLEENVYKATTAHVFSQIMGVPLGREYYDMNEHLKYEKEKLIEENARLTDQVNQYSILTGALTDELYAYEAIINELYTNLSEEDKDAFDEKHQMRDITDLINDNFHFKC